MKKINVILFVFTLFTLASCELIPDEILDIFDPKPDPHSQTCDLVQISHSKQYPEETYSFVIKIDTIGDSNEVVRITTNETVVDELRWDEDESKNIRKQKRTTGRNGLGDFEREVEYDNMGKLVRDFTRYVVVYPNDLISLENTYVYSTDGVEATSTHTFGDSTYVILTNFEYNNGNLVRITSEEDTVNFEYGTLDNKLKDFQTDFLGFEVFSAVSPMGTNAAQIPMPSNKLPIRQTSTYTFEKYSWTLNSNGYPSKVEVRDEDEDPLVYEYAYGNCRPVSK